MTDKNVIVYTLEDCPSCDAVKAAFTDNGITFQTQDMGNIDVMTDLLYQDVTATTAPVVKINDKFFTDQEVKDIQRLVTKIMAL